MNTEKSGLGWTLDTLFAYFSAQVSEIKDSTKNALAAAEKAVEKEERNSDKWRQNANEWRAAMTDREHNFAPIQRLESLEKRFEAREGDRSGKKEMMGWIAAAISLLISLWVVFHK